jgi:tRNA(Ile2) C34 agmatinyltransferase TiaS
VCPECGGRMGEPGKEFKCRGECLSRLLKNYF